MLLYSMRCICELNIFEALYMMPIDFETLLHVWVRCSAKVNLLSILTPRKLVVLTVSMRVPSIERERIVSCSELFMEKSIEWVLFTLSDKRLHLRYSFSDSSSALKESVISFTLLPCRKILVSSAYMMGFELRSALGRSLI